MQATKGGSNARVSIGGVRVAVIAGFADPVVVRGEIKAGSGDGDLYLHALAWTQGATLDVPVMPRRRLIRMLKRAHATTVVDERVTIGQTVGVTVA